MNVYFDIETIPCQDEALIASLTADMADELTQALSEVKAPGNYKDEAKIAEYCVTAREKLVAEHKANVQKAIERTSFDGGMGQVCVIGWAFGDEGPRAKAVESLGSAHEAALLQLFFDSLNEHHVLGDSFCFIGHNSNAFDIPFLWKRAIILGVKPPTLFPRDPKPWGDGTFDTMLAWNGTKAVPGGSMDRICRLLGITGKGDMDGSMVWPMVQAGEIVKVAEYCKGDVARTREMHRRMTFATAGELEVA